MEYGNRDRICIGDGEWGMGIWDEMQERKKESAATDRIPYQCNAMQEESKEQCRKRAKSNEQRGKSNEQRATRKEKIKNTIRYLGK